MITLIKKTLNVFGCDLVRYPYRQEQFFLKLLSRLEIDTLFDIGANVGQFATSIHKHGYKNKIISFEPLEEAFADLERKAKNKGYWEVCHSAIGATDGKVEINVSQNLVSSSILPITEASTKVASETKYYKKEVVTIQRLDSVFFKYVTDKNSNVFVKIDTQGYEKEVIEGAIECLPYIKGFIMELSFVTLYEGETLFSNMISIMESLGYEIWQILPGFMDDKVQHMLQADVVFLKKK